jgi:hypothetical protein
MLLIDTPKRLGAPHISPVQAHIEHTIAPSQVQQMTLSLTAKHAHPFFGVHHYVGF